jgi:hypothetical protein
MTKYIAIVLILGGGALTFRGCSVWSSCGYDCSIAPLFNFPATAAILASGLLLIIGCGMLLGVWLDRTSR